MCTRQPRFNPRSPCGERRSRWRCRWRPPCFNPRSPCGERPLSRQGDRTSARFQPTLPLRGATPQDSLRPSPSPVSTHAPLAGSDRAALLPGSWPPRFNPRSPCGERRTLALMTNLRRLFQPTLPLRGATRPHLQGDHRRRVSTHAPLAGSDFRSRWNQTLLYVSTHAPLAGSDIPPMSMMNTSSCFNPRSPCGERRSAPEGRRRAARFNPRSPCGERRLRGCGFLPRPVVFQPTLPLRGATAPVGRVVADGKFQPTLPLRGATGRRFVPASAVQFQPTLPLRGATATSC